MMNHKERLCKSIEASIHLKLQSPKDFESLRERIYVRLHALVSTTTLKRVWGYLQADSAPSHSTLDTLAQFIGYSDYDTFCDPYFFCYYNCKGGYCFFVRICDTIT